MKQLRIAVCVKRDLHGLTVLRQLIPLLSGHHVKVFCSVKTRPSETTDPVLAKIKHLERDFPMDILGSSATHKEDDFLNQADHPATWTALKNLKQGEGGQDLLDFAPDLVLSIRFSLIFKPWIIEQISLGIVNIHPGPLPKYRGLFTPFWQYYNGEDALGCTVHLVDEGIDTGPVLGFGTIERQRDRSLLWAISTIYCAGLPIIADYVAAAAKGSSLSATPQKAGGNYYNFPTPSDFQSFQTSVGEIVTPIDYSDMLARAWAGLGRN